MPIYEFRCPRCGHKRDVIAPIPTEDDYPKSRCVACSDDDRVVWMQRIMSAPAVIKVK